MPSSVPASTQPCLEAAHLELTEAGAALARAASAYQQQVFLDVTADWDPDERAHFARQFVRFAGALMVRLQETQR
ncbi:DNA-binding MarR family transcriptional regulator [Deinobacterium chartae]|uniref:DNA-binding MarR family transcriptional regulator n=1 Tax=Deinobacterium chartae TaxID=521158 RepID=A0A841I254_9DEIO|nr:hypothetical protein [Deinobacterium chartae]MBB6098490.1 DNA-binding MarR family transcriptional regulator [Deinobacterium chartae]